ncbi:uncharacterized protein LOC131676112 [Topomyia yanbarensis]|uniref:uncharacterized protein LOC131676112 n=1 Tax=Topomyia yanbarensis TaxID=2498891 RepID=UPI00273B3A07|nr:uncharacterized protein LOC131676112 [Topomyia yanbarensis]
MDTVQVALLQLLLLLVALLTHNLANSFPQHYDYVIGGADYGGGATGPNTAGASAGRINNNNEQQQFTCPEPTPTSDCSCMYASTDFEIQCPVINPEITVKIKPGMYAQIQCYEKHDFSEMPILNVGNTSQVKIIHCPLPQRKSIRQFVSFLGVTHVKDFWYQNYGKDLGVRLVRQHFEGMQDLEKLFLSSGIEDIQPDLFADLPNLKWLILRSNHVKLLHNVFDNLTNLQILELGANQITELEPGLFKNQRKLRHLNLWRNQLRNITKESFRGAETLQELDLSVNAIESLNPDVFALLPDLTVLNLGFNRFTALPENLLSDNRNLKEFKFINNQAPLQTLPDNFLGNLPQLKTVILNRCSFTHLPASLFRGSSDITHMDLSYNQLSSVPKLLLRDQLRLQDLNLAYNELEMLPDGLFENTKELLTLQLSYNRLYNLSANIFVSLEKLTVLNIDNNLLHVINQFTFSGTTALEKLYMQNNQLSFHDFSFIQEQDIVDTDGTPFQYLNNLRVLNLRNNSITTIFRDWNYNTLALRDLDLSYNNISTLSYLSLQFVSQEIRVNLSHNRITEIDMKDMEPIITSQRQTDDARIHVDVNNNPLNCNCVIFSFVQYLLHELDKAVYRRIQFSADNLSCMEPKEHRDTPVTQLKTKDLLCQLDQPGTEIKRCPANCSCFVRPVDRGVIVNCTRRGLVEVPPLPQPAMFGFNFLELHIEDNNITRLPTENLTGYGKVAELYAQNNGISVVEPDNLPASLRVLDLTKNKLTMLNQSVVEVLNSSKQLVSLQLSDNRWRCDCDSTQFLNFVQQNHKKIADIGRVTCEDGREFDSITVSELCSENTVTIITVSIVLSIVGLLIGLFTVLYFSYQMEVKVWLFTHNICLWLVSEEELDKDKLYDAFISYSHKDEEFITEHLVPTLEKEPMNFKTCWHVRDWMPGELIPTQITKSVDDSRRTIVVLSTNFLESGWGRMEFRTAHLNSMAENRVRVIVIIYGDIGDIEQLDSELKAYLKMNTYVKWGDPWFWDKLRYAMPHPPTVRGLNKKGLIKNHIKSSVDDKLELIKPVPVTPPPMTTPPAEMNGNITPPFTISNGKVMNGNGYHGNGHIMNGHVANGHVNGAFMINSNAKQSDVDILDDTGEKTEDEGAVTSDIGRKKNLWNKLAKTVAEEASLSTLQAHTVQPTQNGERSSSRPEMALLFKMVLLTHILGSSSAQFFGFDLGFTIPQDFGFTIPREAQQHYDYVIEAYYCDEEVSTPSSSDSDCGTNRNEQWFTCLESNLTSGCSCMYASTNYESLYSVINPEITVKIPGIFAQIQCYEKPGSTPQVKIIPCPVTSYFGMEHIKTFWLQNYGKDLRFLLFQQHFENMPDILSLPSPEMADVSYIRWLVLRSNTNDLGRVLSNFNSLIKLDLADNQITELKPGLFKDQRQLLYLNLKRNQLHSITKDTFRGVETLEELDISDNVFESLNTDVFTLLPDLTVLNLGFNRFAVMPEQLLSNNRKLKEFSLSSNQGPLRTLPENFLGNLTQLKTVILNRCNFANLPASLFRGSRDIMYMDLSYNQLSSVPKLLLQDQLRLEDLNLAFNKLEILPDGLFENTKELVVLQLSYNRLCNLSANIFESMEKLRVLKIDNNYLYVIDQLTFSRTSALEELSMQNNQLSFHDSILIIQEEVNITDNGSPFQNLINLRIISLSNNNITTIFRDWNSQTVKLRELDLSYNQISTLSYLNLQFISQDIHVNLSHNRITSVDLNNKTNDDVRILVDINENPLNCDCNILSFVEHVQNSKRQPIQFSVDELRCSEPAEHSNIKIKNVRTDKLLCSLDHPDADIKLCPASCSCFTRPLDHATIVNCSGRGLFEVPPLPKPTLFGYDFLELHIGDNNITRLPTTEHLTGYEQVAELYAQNNSIWTLERDNLPNRLRVLDLRRNRLTTLNQSAVKKLISSEELNSLKLSGNPWHCDCDATQFLSFIMFNTTKVKDFENMTCEDGRKFASIIVGALCSESISSTITVVIVVLSIFAMLTAFFMILFSIYHMEIKVWLFKHNLCMWFVSEEELDKDKLYDAFISYSHKDEEFITDHLVTTLESEPMNFKTCWHVRDWIPGELIPSQIAKSVDDSRRTIVVLSTNFLESGWGRMEFHTAHLNSMAEKRVRVIVVIYGDIGDIERLDSELKAYLKMNTYIKWGDPWFWDKLRYSMPHPPRVKGLRGNKNVHELR